jgi:hypothetical protein
MVGLNGIASTAFVRLLMKIIDISQIALPIIQTELTLSIAIGADGFCIKDIQILSIIRKEICGIVGQIGRTPDF